jgi:ABC-type nitrate/sulfonate/bicarbonate transport system substrate-binding protein
MRMRKTLAALALLAASTTLATAQDAVTFRLNWYMGGLHVPFYYGKEKCRWWRRAPTRSVSPTRPA